MPIDGDLTVTGAQSATQNRAVVDSDGNLHVLATIENGEALMGRLLATTLKTTGTTFTTGTGTNLIRVRLGGGGGAGGGADTAAVSGAAGGGGSNGGYAEKLFAVSPTTAYTISIGAAGTPGAAGSANGGDGGDTTFAVGATTVTAKGGKGGVGMAAGTTILAALGGTSPAVSTNGDLNMGGAPGGFGLRMTGLLAVSGHGGSGPFGSGGNSVLSGAGAVGVGNCSGGSGGAVINAGSAVAGGAGLGGAIIVDEYS